MRRGGDYRATGDVFLHDVDNAGEVVAELNLYAEPTLSFAGLTILFTALPSAGQTHGEPKGPAFTPFSREHTGIPRSYACQATGCGLVRPSCRSTLSGRAKASPFSTVTGLGGQCAASVVATTPHRDVPRARARTSTCCILHTRALTTRTRTASRTPSPSNVRTHARTAGCRRALTGNQLSTRRALASVRPHAHAHDPGRTGLRCSGTGSRGPG